MNASLSAEASVGRPQALREMSAEHPQVVRDSSGDRPAEYPSSTRARDNGIRDKDKRRSVDVLHDGIDYPYMLEELLAKYNVTFARTPVNERCVFCNATYLGDTKVKLRVHDYAVSNRVWLVDFYGANNKDFSEPVEGLLTIWFKKWRNAGLGDPKTAFAGLCAVTADGRRNILAIECNLEARL